MIYLDSAATSYHIPDGVARAVAEAISHMGNPGRGAHEASLDASRVVYGTREKMAELFGAEEASQIVFTANSTESLNIAIQGLVDPGDNCIFDWCVLRIREGSFNFCCYQFIFIIWSFIFIFVLICNDISSLL